MSTKELIFWLAFILASIGGYMFAYAQGRMDERERQLREKQREHYDDN